MRDWIVKMDGVTVRSFHNRTYDYVQDWAVKYCHGKVKIIALVEGINPKASRMHYNELFENYGAYKYNPLVMES